MADQETEDKLRSDPYTPRYYRCTYSQDMGVSLHFVSRTVNNTVRLNILDKFRVQQVRSESRHAWRFCCLGHDTKIICRTETFSSASKAFEEFHLVAL